MEPLKTLKVLTQLLATLIKDKNFVSPTLLADVLAAICDANILDENGNLPDYVENTIRRNDCPPILSQGSSTAQVLKIFKSLLNDTDYNS